MSTPRGRTRRATVVSPSPLGRRRGSRPAGRGGCRLTRRAAGRRAGQGRVRQPATVTSDASYGQVAGRPQSRAATTVSTGPGARARSCATRSRHAHGAAPPTPQPAAYAQQRPAAQPADGPGGWSSGGLRGAAAPSRPRSRPTTRRAMIRPALHAASNPTITRLTRGSSLAPRSPPTDQAAYAQQQPYESSGLRAAAAAARTAGLRSGGLRAQQAAYAQQQAAYAQASGSIRTGSSPRSPTTTRRPTRRLRAAGIRPAVRAAAHAGAVLRPDRLRPAAQLLRPAGLAAAAVAGVSAAQRSRTPTASLASPRGPLRRPIGTNRQVAMVGPSRSSWPARAAHLGRDLRGGRRPHHVAWQPGRGGQGPHPQRGDDGSRSRVQQAGECLRCAPAHPRHHAVDRCGRHPGAPDVGPRLRRPARIARHESWASAC